MGGAKGILDAFVGGGSISGGAYPAEGGAAEGAIGVVGILNGPDRAAGWEDDARSV